MERVSCDSLPPTDFKLYNSADESVYIENAIQVAVENCQLCRSTKRQFYCAKCVNSGRFHRSSYASGEDRPRYSEKLKQWHALKREKSVLSAKVEEAISSSKLIKANSKSQQIFEIKSRIQVLKDVLTDAKKQIDSDMTGLKTAIEKNRHRQKKAERHIEKINHITSYIGKCIQARQDILIKLSEQEEKVSDVKRQQLHDLQQFIFPITQVMPRSDTDHAEQSMVSALAEARHTSYIRGRWVYTDTSGELHFCIVEPSLPGSGDIPSSIYNLWLKENQGALKGPDEEPDSRNPLFTTCAALSYVTQIVTLVAHFLDVNLPCHMCYSKFYQELSEGQFCRAVNMLNHNILYLCFTQHVCQDLVSPRHTMHNLVALLRSPSLGRTGSFMTNSEMIQSLYDLPLGTDPQDLSSSSSSSASSDLSSDDLVEAAAVTGDWEHVSCTMPETTVPPASPPSMSTTQLASRIMQGGASTTGGIAGGLVTSAAAGVSSLWRFAVGKGDKS